MELLVVECCEERLFYSPASRHIWLQTSPSGNFFPLTSGWYDLLDFVRRKQLRLQGTWFPMESDFKITCDNPEDALRTLEFLVDAWGLFISEGSSHR